MTFLDISSEKNLRFLSPASEFAISFLNIIGNFFALIFFISPLFQIINKKLYREHQNLRNMPLFLILTIIFNCLFWLLYLFSIKRKNEYTWIPLLVSNLCGLILNTGLLFFYLFIYLERKIVKFLGFGFFVVDLMVEVIYLTFRYIIKKDKESDNFQLVGFIATIINVLMYSSPIQNIKLIIKLGKYEALPIYTLITGFLVTLCFFIQGIITYFTFNDERKSATQTMISNGISFFFLLCFSGIYVYFYYKPPVPMRVNEDDIIQGNAEEDFNRTTSSEE